MYEVRPGDAADARELLDVHRAAILAADGDAYTPAQRRAWAAAQDDPEQYPLADSTQWVAVAEDADGAVVAFVGVDLADGVLETLYVHPDAQGVGLGTRLLERAETTAREDGLDHLVMAASRNAVAFYEGRGYRQTAETFTLAFGEHELAFERMEKQL